MATSTDSVELVGDEATRNLARAVVFAAATAATAPVDLVHPLAPNVPVTLQTLWVFLAGILLGPVWGGAAFCLYLAAGLVGLPVFAGGASGLGVVFGHTGGFLLGFPVAAAVTGAVAHLGVGLGSPSDLPVIRIVAGVVAGSVVVYAFGAAGYAVAAGVGLVTAVFAVVVPFVPVALLKMAATVAVVRSDAVVAR